MAVVGGGSGSWSASSDDCPPNTICVTVWELYNPLYADPSNDPYFGGGGPINIAGDGGDGGGIDKKTLAKQLKKYKNCAALFGGLSKALALVNQAQRSAIDAPGFVPPNDQEGKDIVNALSPDPNGTVLAPAGVQFSGTPNWNQQSFTIYTNSEFTAENAGQQLTTLFHGLHHVALGHTPESQALDQPNANPDLQDIVTKCHTLPPPGLPQNQK